MKLKKKRAKLIADLNRKYREIGTIIQFFANENQVSVDYNLIRTGNHFEINWLNLIIKK